MTVVFSVPAKHVNFSVINDLDIIAWKILTQLISFIIVYIQMFQPEPLWYACESDAHATQSCLLREAAQSYFSWDKKMIW